jgi:hypothetical protein
LIFSVVPFSISKEFRSFFRTLKCSCRVRLLFRRMTFFSDGCGWCSCRLFREEFLELVFLFFFFFFSVAIFIERIDPSVETQILLWKIGSS